MAHKEELEGKHSGKIVALYEEGVAAIGEDTDSVYREAIKTHPSKSFLQVEYWSRFVP